MPWIRWCDKSRAVVRQGDGGLQCCSHLSFCPCDLQVANSWSVIDLSFLAGVPLSEAGSFPLSEVQIVAVTRRLPLYDTLLDHTTVL